MKFKEEEWSTVTFSDEKEFNLDVLDMFPYYCQDLRTEPSILTKFQVSGD